MAVNGISVIVCTYNRLGLLKHCLEALQKQTYRNFEVIIVNDASSDGTKEYLNSLDFFNFKFIHHQNNLGLSSSRNDGIRMAKYEVTAFTDDDCLPDKNWLLELKNALESSGAHFGAGQTFLVSNNYRGRFPERVVQNIGAAWPMGNNLIFRKSVFEAVGLFDPAMDEYNNDDTEMALRALKHGFKFISIPTAIVHHQKTYWTPKQLLKSSRNAAVWPILKKRYPQHYLYFKPSLLFGFIVNAKEYLYLLTMPVLLSVLFVRYVLNGQRDFRVFFAKWPLYFVLRRFYIYKTALQQRVFMI